MKVLLIIVSVFIFLIPIPVQGQEEQKWREWQEDEEMQEQEERVGRFEFEAGLSYSFAAANRGVDNVRYRHGGYIEGRYNFEYLSFDTGLQVAFSSMKKTRETEETFTRAKYRSLSVMAIGDFALHIERNVNTYVGFGMGISFNNTGSVFGKGSMANFCVMPRIGARFFGHINLSFDYHFTHKNYSHANINLGFYF